jgi:acetylornithine deacetylase/succinyl-diaminopimelate desuccinylase-like protein
MDTLSRVAGRVAERFPADLERIRGYLRMPSVSATGEGIRDVAAATGAWIEGAGGSFELVETPGHPLVLGELPGPDGQPELILGCKGLCDLKLVVEAGDWGGPAIDLHSSEQAWIASPVWALVQALATLTGPDEEIRVAGLDGGPGPGDGDRRLLAELAAGFDPAEHLREARAARYRLDGGPAELLEALLFRPTMNISGLSAGYVGPGGKTITPGRAEARVDIRLVGGDPEQAAAAVRRHLADHGFGHVQVALLDAYPGAKAPPGDRSELAMRASCQALGRTALPYPLAPWWAPYFVFDRILGLPWASGGVGHAAGAHGPDECATVAGLEEHIVGAAAFLLAYAGLPQAAPAGAPDASAGDRARQ